MKTLLVLFFLIISLAGNAQSAELATSYFRKGEYEKAILLFEPLLESNPIRQDYFKSLLTCYQQLEQYDKAKALIQKQLGRFPEQVYLNIELGYNFQLTGEQRKAEQYYNESIDLVRNNPNIAFMIGRTFRQNHLLDEALETYSIAKKLNPKLNTEISEAQIYGEKGNIDKMFGLYLDLVDKNENYFSTVQRYVAVFISENGNDPNNLLFKKLLLKRAQTNPKDAWNILLSWLFMQQGEYKKALTQEKSLFKRKPGSLERTAEIAFLSFEKGEYETSKAAFQFMLEQTSLMNQDNELAMSAEIFLLKIENITAVKESQKALVETGFEAMIRKYGIGQETLELQLAFADFLTYDYNKPDKAISHLESILPITLAPVDKGLVQMKIADILVFTGQFNQALVLYSQIQFNLKNSELAQEAMFKVARTSYFKGDFTWAQNQLKVLKSSTSQLIANDALDLSLKIVNNIDKDSLNQGLKLFAKAELLGFQHNYQQAIDTLSVVLTKYKGQHIEDDALFSQASYFEKVGDYKAAEGNLIGLIDLHPESLFIDDCIYQLGMLYQNRLQDPEKAKMMFERIIFEYPSSIYLVDARIAFRKLRGDDL